VHEKGAEVPDMGRPVNSRPAAVESKHFTLRRKNLLTFTGKGIVKVKAFHDNISKEDGTRILPRPLLNIKDRGESRPTHSGSWGAWARIW
jgi:hypothetical protein